MNLTVNGEAVTVTGAPTVASVVDDRSDGRQGVAVAVNDVVVPRSTWDDRTLAEGDRVEILSASAGG